MTTPQLDGYLALPLSGMVATFPIPGAQKPHTEMSQREEAKALRETDPGAHWKPLLP